MPIVRLSVAFKDEETGSLEEFIIEKNFSTDAFIQTIDWNGIKCYKIIEWEGHTNTERYLPCYRYRITCVYEYEVLEDE